jgi:hypothetical protein
MPGILSLTPNATLVLLPNDGSPKVLDDISEDFDVYLFADYNFNEPAIAPTGSRINSASRNGGIVVSYAGIGPFRGLRGWSASQNGNQLVDGTVFWILATRRGQ